MLTVPRFFARLAPALAAVSVFVALCAPSALRAQNPGRVDPSFNPGASALSLPDGAPVFGGTVNTITVDPNSGNVLVGGNFTNAVTAVSTGGQRNFLALFAETGDLNTNFNSLQTSGPDGPVFTTFLFPDRVVPNPAPRPPTIFPGGFFIGGDFRRIQNQARLRAGAVSSSTGANTGANDNPGATFNPSVNDQVLASVLQSGQPVIGGRFTSVGGRLISRVARLSEATGAPDPTFIVGSGADGDISALAVDAGSRLYLGGEFLSFNSTLAARLIRLTPDGPVDATFNVGSGFNLPVRAIQTTTADGTPLANNQILVAGEFTTYRGAAVNRLVRLNPDGTPDTAFNAAVATGTGFNGTIRALAVQTDGSVVVGGDFTQFNGAAANGVARFSTAGVFDAAFNTNVGTGANGPVLAVAVDPFNDSVYAGGSFTRFNSRAANPAVRVGFVRLAADGTLDAAFNTASGFGVGFTTQEVTAVATTSNGKVLVGGNFDSINGRPRNFIERLNANGTPDPTFQINRGPDNIVTALFAQPQTNPPDGSDDNIIIAGQFTTVDDGTTSQAISGLARLGPTGALDPAFKPAVDGQVNAFAGSANGTFVIAGDFRNVGTTPSGGIARLTAAGALDTSFNPGVGFGGGVDALAVQADGRLLAGGRFTAFNGPNGGTAPFVARILTDGSFDRSFVSQPNNRVEALAVQTDGSILIGGTFTTVDGVGRTGLARLGVNGRLDASFAPVLGFDPNVNPPQVEVLTITVQPDNRLLISGTFNSVNGVPRNNVARLNPDGTLDPSFGSNAATAGPNGAVETLVRKTNGAILIGGTFTSVDGVPRARLAQLQGDQPPTTLQFSASVFNVNQVEGSATITVTRLGSPAGAVGVTYATSDGTATAGVNYATRTGTLFFADGDTAPKSFVVPVFVVQNTSGPTVFTVNLTLSNPTGDATIGNPGTAVLNIVSETLSTVQFAATTFAARETDGLATITVTRTGPSRQTTVTVDYATSDTNGAANVRYTPVSGTLTFGPTTDPSTPQSQTFTIPIINNAIRDGDQVVQLTLGTTTGFVVRGSPATANLVIVDDETPPAGSNATFSASAYSVREDAGNVAIVIQRSDVNTGARVAVSYSTANGSANSAGRFTPTSGTVIFEAGDASPKVISIPILNNTARDGDATVQLTLTSTSGGLPVPGGTATLTIVDDEALPSTLPTTFQFATPTFTVFETQTTATITVTRVGGPLPPRSAAGGGVSVQYFVSDLTGKLGVNYADTFASPTIGTLFWSANDFTPKTFTVAILRDNLATGNNQLNVTLASPQSLTDSFGTVIIPASLGTPNQATLSIVDADLPAILQFSQDVFQTFEDSGAAVVTVIRTGGAGTDVSVKYSTGGGTAAPGLRYTPTNGTLSWAAGDSTSRVIVIPILQDNATEPDQTTGLALGQTQGNALLGPQATATLLITDDDGGQFFPVISVTTSTPAIATTDGRTKGFFFITRQNRLGQTTNLDLPLTVTYKVRGTGINGQEYRFLPEVVTIPAGEETVRLKVKAINRGGDRTSSVKIILNPDPNYYINSGAARAKIRIVFPGTVVP